MRARESSSSLLCGLRICEPRSVPWPSPMARLVVDEVLRLFQRAVLSTLCVSIEKSKLCRRWPGGVPLAEITSHWPPYVYPNELHVRKTKNILITVRALA